VNKEALIAENEALKAQIAQLKIKEQLLLDALYGKRNERHVASAVNADQLSLGFEELNPRVQEANEPPAEQTIQVSYERKKKTHPGRHPLPDHLEVEEVIIEPQEDTTGAKHIKDIVVDTLEYVPASLKIKRYILRRYEKSIINEQGEQQSVFLQGHLPVNRPIPKSIAGSGLLTQLISSKFLYHLPFYRQIRQFKELYEVELNKSSVNDWFVAVCTLLQPLYQQLKEKILQSNYIQADESPIKVQDKTKQGSTHQGYQWLYHAPTEGLVLFDYQKGRGKQGPKAILADFEGTLQTDGYAVYDKLTKNKAAIKLIGCAAHARRYFHQALQSEPQAAKAIEYFKSLYAIERHIKEQIQDSQATVAYRQAKAQPIWTALFEWAEAQYPQALPKSPFGKALYYLLQRKEKLQGYLKAAHLQIDNNLVENSVRPLALGRKNYLFAGSHKAAQRIAMMYSFFGSCQKQNINPVKWLQYVLDHISQQPINQIEELLPGSWVNGLD